MHHDLDDAPDFDDAPDLDDLAFDLENVRARGRCEPGVLVGLTTIDALLSNDRAARRPAPVRHRTDPSARPRRAATRADAPEPPA